MRRANGSEGISRANEHDARISAAYTRIKEAWREDQAAVQGLLSTPCSYQPGSVDKVAVMMARRALGLPLFITHDRDCHIHPPEHRRELVYAEALEPVGVRGLNDD